MKHPNVGDSPDGTADIIDILGKSRQAAFTFKKDGECVWISPIAKSLSSIVELAECGGEVASGGGENGLGEQWPIRLFRSRSGKGPASLRFVFSGLSRPVELAWSPFGPKTDPWLACVVFGWEELHPFTVSTLKSKFKLTNRECEICVHLLSGSSTIEIARRVGSSIGTVRVHIKRIHSKLDVTTQIALFSFLSGIKG